MKRKTMILVPWSESEVDEIRRFAKAGFSSAEAARAVGRSPGSTRFKAYKNGIRFKSLGRRHSQLQKARYAK